MKNAAGPFEALTAMTCLVDSSVCLSLAVVAVTLEPVGEAAAAEGV